MKNEKGLSILEVIWSILIISSILSTCFTYQIHYNKKVKTSIFEKVILIEYYQIVEIFKVEYKNFNETFIKTANNFKSCGYIFLVCNEHNELSLLPINSQDTTVPFNLCPLMCIDLFEHAYIFDYNNRREDYIKNFIKFINWDKVNEKYVECLKYLN